MLITCETAGDPSRIAGRVEISYALGLVDERGLGLVAALASQSRDAHVDFGCAEELQAPDQEWLMTYMLDEAVKRVRTRSDAEQDAIAAMIFAELEEERLWDEAFERSPEVLSQLAREALEEHRAGRTLPLDPDQM